MKILIHDYAGHPFQVQLSRTLAGRGHHVVHAYASGLLTPRGALQKRPGDPGGFDPVEVPMSPRYRENKYSFLKRRAYEVAYGGELVRLLDRVRPDVAISGNTPTEPQWAFVNAACRRHVPVISWVQDFYSLAVGKLAQQKFPVIGALAGAWYRFLDAKSLRNSAAVVAITEDFEPILCAYGVPAKRITVVPNWAPLNELPQRSRDNKWSTLAGLDGKFCVLYSGTLAMKHNPDLLKALAEAFRTDPEVRIVVISEGPGAEYLARRKLEDRLENLILLPFQKFEDMPDVLATADVLVSILEADAGIFSVPSKVLTYLCAGRALLGAMPSENLASRIVRKEEAGLVVPPDDPSGFVEAAKRLRRETELRKRLAINGRAYAEREFDIDRITDRFEMIFRKATPR